MSRDSSSTLSLGGLSDALRTIFRDLHETYVDWEQRRRFSPEERTRLYQSLASFIQPGTGISVSNTLKLIVEIETTDGGSRSPAGYAASRWAADLESARITELNRAVEGWVPDLDRQLIEIGEKTGTLPATLRNLVANTKRERATRRLFVSSMGFPVAVLALNLLFMTGLHFFLLPELLPYVRMANLSPPTPEVIALIGFTGRNILEIMLVISLLFYGLSRSLTRWSGPARAWADKNILPYRIYRMEVGTRLLYAAAALESANLSATRQLDMLQRDQSPWMQWHLEQARRYMETAGSLFVALHMAGNGFPDREINQRVAMVKRAGGGGREIETVAQDWAEISTDRMTGLARKLALQFGAPVILLDITVMVSIFNISKGIG